MLQISLWDSFQLKQKEGAKIAMVPQEKVPRGLRYRLAFTWRTLTAFPTKNATGSHLQNSSGYAAQCLYTPYDNYVFTCCPLLLGSTSWGLVICLKHFSIFNAKNNTRLSKCLLSNDHIITRTGLSMKEWKCHVEMGDTDSFLFQINSYIIFT